MKGSSNSSSNSQRKQKDKTAEEDQEDQPPSAVLRKGAPGKTPREDGAEAARAMERAITPTGFDDDGRILRTPLSKTQYRRSLEFQKLVKVTSFSSSMVTLPPPIPSPQRARAQSVSLALCKSAETLRSMKKTAGLQQQQQLRLSLLSVSSSKPASSPLPSPSSQSSTSSSSSLQPPPPPSSAATEKTKSANEENENENEEEEEEEEEVKEKRDECEIIAEIKEHAAEDLGRLAEYIKGKCSVVFITGAGISVGSGIPTYRTGQDGIWNNWIYEWGTRAKFLSDPGTWWNEFWFKSHDTDPFLNSTPCHAHYALANIMRAFPNVKLVTQNVDRLHLKAGTDRRRLIEIHGALGIYRCVNKACPYSSTKHFEGLKFEKDAAGRFVPPHCPHCGSYIMPMSLFFDELYSSHTFFQKDLFRDWIDHADVMVFVGTSFSVNVTTEALRVGSVWCSDIYNLNIEIPVETAVRLPANVTNVAGPADILLPLLANMCGTDDSLPSSGSQSSFCLLQ